MKNHASGMASTWLQSLTVSARLASVVGVLMLLVASGCGASEQNPSAQEDVTSADAGADTSEVSEEDVAHEDISQEDTSDAEDGDDADVSPDVQEPPAQILSAPVIAQFEQAIEDGHPAIIVAVVDGEQSRVYGFGEVDSGDAPDGKTLFEIGSITKTFTALLLADAVEAGEVTLEQPVQELLPDFGMPARNGLEITLENLATQRSGLPRLPTNFQPADMSNPYVDYDAAKLQSFLADYAMPRDPGAAYEYSNVGYGLLGYALGEKAGSDYATILDTKIFEPLGMLESLPGVSGADATRLAKGHSSAGHPVPNWEFAVLAPTGAIISHGDDMVRYLEANMGLFDTPLYPAMQLAHQPRADGPSASVPIGLGWMTVPSGSGDIVWHNGMTGGYASFMGFLADGSRGVVVLTNILKSVDALAIAVLTE